ncbi:MAG: insulinase family protein [Prevotella sp.]|nr:insulinase family protein [Prevotella sp.]
MKYNTATLDNGLRIIHLPSNSQVIYCGYQICVGTRDEQVGEEGLAHFVEHVTFKGTKRRNSIQVINALENVGGELNAYTNKENTTYYAALLCEYLPRAVDLLSDIVFNSVYPRNELEKEKEVIIEEIESYNDSPAELIYDEFENILFEGHPLGHNILGTADNVRSFTSEDAQRFARKFYRPENSVFFAYGNVEFSRLVKLIAKKLKCNLNYHIHKKHSISTFRMPYTTKNQSHSMEIETDKGTHQAHVMLGSHAYDVHHPDRIALYLLNNMLGGPGLNARLSLSLREKRGLVYTVESMMTAYSDTGVWTVYFGCDHDDVKKCIRLVRKELEKFQKKPVSSRQLAMAKVQIKGQIGVACDNRESFALEFGKSFLQYGWEKDVERLYEQIDAVTTEQLQRVACDVFSENKIITLIFR